MNRDTGAWDSSMWDQPTPSESSQPKLKSKMKRAHVCP